MGVPGFDRDLEFFHSAEVPLASLKNGKKVTANISSFNQPILANAA